ncbi:hypothetical protein B0H65DRAFT_307532 [Neurospora tetraspora]|uniref:Uncharacterized protein n=1 Tax=Neurospora tetraspora TaxID=94610 RepID=A0AAE0J7C2_9PEZI|nr:hypothetical protein B0H65DRAFT_307532 [Neurospora tetraspora]
MEALRNLEFGIPDWLHRLDELNGQIEQRQQELAQLTESKPSSPGREPGSPSRKSLRNKGSTESLRPKDEPSAHPNYKEDETTDKRPTSPQTPGSPGALQRTTSQVRAAGQAKARATLRKRQRTDSVMSAENADKPPKYRSRSMIIVYYDSYVQSFFEELVKFVSASRNMMRKAKMAAKVAQIKRLAELNTPPDDDDNGGDAANGELVPDPKAVNNIDASAAALAAENLDPVQAMLAARRARDQVRMLAQGGGVRANPLAGIRMSAAMGRAGARQPPQGAGPDVYDALDNGLEFVQSMCEHAAHQFLRDGDCGEEVTKIKQRLSQTKDLASKEMERVRREDLGGDGSGEPVAGGAAGSMPRGGTSVASAIPMGMGARSYRPQSMRRVTSVKSTRSSVKEAAKDSVVVTVVEKGVKRTAPATESEGSTVSGSVKGDAKIEVDEGLEDGDASAANDGIIAAVDPSADPEPIDISKLVYRSTRLMR